MSPNAYWSERCPAPEDRMDIMETWTCHDYEEFTTIEKAYDIIGKTVKLE